MSVYNIEPQHDFSNGVKKGLQKALDIVELFNVTPCFDAPCTAFERTERIATAIRRELTIPK